ncbi:MAG: hypothetical protein ACLSIF_08940 [Faecalimonas umbilicata]
MYAEKGEQMLCRTCRMYPRHIEEYEGIREISLFPSHVWKRQRLYLAAKNRFVF